MWSKHDAAPFIITKSPQESDEVHSEGEEGASASPCPSFTHPERATVYNMKQFQKAKDNEWSLKMSVW